MAQDLKLAWYSESLKQSPKVEKQIDRKSIIRIESSYVKPYVTKWETIVKIIYSTFIHVIYYFVILSMSTR